MNVGGEPLAAAEEMIAAIRDGNRERAARVYGGNLTESGEVGCTQALARHILEAETGLDWVVSLLDPDREPESAKIRFHAFHGARRRGVIAQRFAERLSDAIPASEMSVRIALLRASERALERLLTIDEGNEKWLRSLVLCRQQIARASQSQDDARSAKAIVERVELIDTRRQSRLRNSAMRLDGIAKVLQSNGDLGGALGFYRSALAIRQRLVAPDPSNAALLRAVAFSHENIADVLQSQGDMAAAVEQIRSLISISEVLLASDPSDDQAAIAVSIARDRLGSALQKSGDLDGALDAFRSALEIDERLIAEEPASTFVRRNSAIGHDHIATVLRAQGEQAAALATYRTALSIREQLLAADETNVTLQRAVALSHSEIGSVLSEQGDTEGALAAYRLSVAIYDRLSRKGDAASLRGVATRHQQIAVLLKSKRNFDGAIEHARAWVDAREALLAHDPDDASMLSDLAIGQHWLGEALQLAGKASDALTAYRASAATREKYAVSVAARSDLARTYEKIGDLLLKDNRDLAAALEAHRSALAIRQRLAEEQPGDARRMSNRARSQNDIGIVLEKQGDLAGALASYRTAIDVSQRVVALDPSEDHSFDLAIYHTNAALMLRRLGDTNGALSEYRASAALRERVAEGHPTSEVLEGLLRIHGNIAEILEERRDSVALLEQQRICIAVRERILGADPRHVASRQNLSVNHEKMGDALTAQGRTAEALAAHRTALAIRQELATALPKDPVHQRNLSITLRKMSDLLVTEGDLTGALEAARSAQAIRERLAAGEPDNAQRQDELAVTHEQVGGILAKQGDVAAAQTAYRAAQAIREREVARDPENVTARLNLSLTQDSLGAVAASAKDWTEALMLYRYSLAVRQSIAEKRPDALAQYNVSVSHEKIGDMLLSLGEQAGALEAYQASLTLRLKAIETEPTSAMERALGIAYERAGNVLLAQGDNAGAVVALEPLARIAEKRAAEMPDDIDRQRAFWTVCSKIAIALDRKHAEPKGDGAWPQLRELVESSVSPNADALEWWRKGRRLIVGAVERGLELTQQDHLQLFLFRMKTGEPARHGRPAFQVKEEWVRSFAEAGSNFRELFARYRVAYREFNARPPRNPLATARLVLPLTLFLVGIAVLGIAAPFVVIAAKYAGLSLQDAIFLQYPTPHAERARDLLRTAFEYRHVSLAVYAAYLGVGLVMGALMMADGRIVRSAIVVNSLFVAYTLTVGILYYTRLVPRSAFTIRTVGVGFLIAAGLFAARDAFPRLFATGERKHRYEFFFSGIYGVTISAIFAQRFGNYASTFTGLIFLGTAFVVMFLTERVVVPFLRVVRKDEPESMAAYEAEVDFTWADVRDATAIVRKEFLGFLLALFILVIAVTVTFVVVSEIAARLLK